MLKFLKIFFISFGVLVIVSSVLLGVFFHQLNQITVRPTKAYAIMYVSGDDVIDYKAMMDPPEKYSQLMQINEEMREKVAEYMKCHNYKLKGGKQEFVRIHPSYEELIEHGFIFEKIE